MKENEIYTNFIETRYNYDLTRMHRIVSQSRVQMTLLFTVFSGILVYRFNPLDPIKVTHLISGFLFFAFIVCSVVIIFFNNTEKIRTSSKLLKEIEIDKIDSKSLSNSINKVMMIALEEISHEINILNKVNSFMTFFGMFMILFMLF